MIRSFVRWVSMAALSFFATFGFGADLVVEAPAVVAGDRWEFAGTRNGAPSSFSITVLERQADGLIRVKVERPGREATELRGPNMEFLYGGRPEYPQVLARYPLKPGGGWQFDQPTGSSTSSYTGRGKVIAQRTVTVPAGTFECLEVEAEAQYSIARSYNNEHKSTRSYCPAIKWYAVDVYKSTTWSAYNPADNATVDGEIKLMKFTPGR